MQMNDKPEGFLTTGEIRSLRKEGRRNHAEPLQSLLRPAPKKLPLKCGHKLDTGALPSINCVDCWKVFFMANKEMTAQSFQAIKEGREVEIIGTHGSKYLKQLKKFAVFIYEVAEAEKTKEQQDGK